MTHDKDESAYLWATWQRIIIGKGTCRPIEANMSASDGSRDGEVQADGKHISMNQYDKQKFDPLTIGELHLSILLNVMKPGDQDTTR